MRSNSKRILQLSATDDPMIPVAEQRTIAQNLQTEYTELSKGGHFVASTNEELFEVILKFLNEMQ